MTLPALRRLRIVQIIVNKTLLRVIQKTIHGIHRYKSESNITDPHESDGPQTDWR